MPGTLYVVATPIGNLEDITLRALRILREVDLIACEDTRHTAKLLNHFHINTPTISYHEHNEQERAERLVEMLEKGKSVAVVCDAGTPGISDPGYRIVRASHEAAVPVVPIPGACSFVAALSASGRPTDSFTFLGFLPSRHNARRALLLALKEEPRTLVFFEAPGRLLATLHDVRAVLGSRKVTVAREITKIHEEILAGPLEVIEQHFHNRPARGEILLMIEKGEISSDPAELTAEQLEKRVEALMSDRRLSKTEALRELSRELNTPKRELYRRLLAAKREDSLETR